MLLPLKKNMPAFYEGIRDMQALLESEQKQFDILDKALLLLNDNQFVQTADEKTITQLENLFYIVADKAKEDIGFRRKRLLNRYATNPPFTLQYLHQKLDSIVGKDKYEIDVDYNNYSFYITTSASDANYYGEIIATVNAIKPCHMIFIYKPSINTTMSLSEEISTSQIQWNYRLGVSWNLGAKPFTSYTNLEVVKELAVPSITSEFLNQTAGFAASNIAKVRINNSINITSFVLKSSVDNIATIEYKVEPQAGLNEITNIKLLDSLGKILTESTIYLPVKDSVIIKHAIPVKEGI